VARRLSNMHSVQQMFAASIIWLYRGGKDRVWLRRVPCTWSATEALHALRGKWRPFGLGSSDFLISGLVRLSIHPWTRVEPGLPERQPFASVPAVLTRVAGRREHAPHLPAYS